MRMDAKVALSLVLIGFTDPDAGESRSPSNGQDPARGVAAQQSPSTWRLDSGGGILHADRIPPAGLPLRDAVLVGETWYAMSREGVEEGSPGDILALSPDEGPWTTVDGRPPFAGRLQAGRTGTPPAVTRYTWWWAMGLFR